MSIIKSQKDDTWKKRQDVLFSENQFCSVWVWDLLHLTPWVFWSKIFTRCSTLWLLSFAEIWAPHSSHKIDNKFLVITARAEGKVRWCVKLFDFFRGWILIRLTWNMSRFVPNSVEIVTWNFRKKLFRKNFPEILCNKFVLKKIQCVK